MLIKLFQNKLQTYNVFKVPWLTIGVTVGMIFLYIFAGPIFDLLLFDKKAIGQGEVWRFFTGHFVHCRFEHLFWDLVAFLILGIVIEMYARKDLIPSLIVSCLAVSLWLLFIEGYWRTYCGLSGALNGLAVVAAVSLWRQTKNRVFLIVLLSTMAKIIFELITHQTLFTSLSSQAVPSAHAVGFMIGVLYVLRL